jgi:SAM-dependent methyltransferase
METVACPYCGNKGGTAWAEERGFTVMRCGACRFLFVNPRPDATKIDSAVRTGVHGNEVKQLNVIARRHRAKINRYRSVLARMFDDTWQRRKPVSWLDVGAGYGEVMEAVISLAPPGSRIDGIEPMAPKAALAQELGLNVKEGYLQTDHPKVDVVSLIDVFSHIPSFNSFLADVREVLNTGGEIFVVTGNLANLDRRDEFHDELGLPDHLAFAGEEHLLGFLDRAGFSVVRIERVRFDGLGNTIKTVVKKALGRPVLLRLPYSSRYRQLLVRARLR